MMSDIVCGPGTGRCRVNGYLCSAILRCVGYRSSRRPSRRLHHRVPEQHIRFRLIVRAVALQPFEYICVESHDYWFLGWPVILADLGSGPVDDLGHFGEINVRVFFGCDVCDLAFLFFCELLHMLSSLGWLLLGLRLA